MKVRGCYRERAKGATFFGATEGETVRPMLDVCWAPMLSAFSVLFDRHSEGDDPRTSLRLVTYLMLIRMHGNTIDISE